MALRPGAPEAIREAARTIGEQIATSGAVEREPEEYLVSEPAVDGETPQRASPPEGEQLERRIVEEETPKEIKEDADAFAVKLYPAGDSAQVSRREPEPRTEGEKRRKKRLFGDASAERRARAPALRLSAKTTWRRLGGLRALRGRLRGGDDRIRLSRTMLSDHFLPKYIEALEAVRAGLEAETRS